METSKSTKRILEAQEEAGKFRLVISILTVLSASFLYGVAVGISGPALVYFQDPDQTSLEAPLTKEEGSWFVACHMLSVMCGTLLSGRLCDAFGRKRPLIICGFFYLPGFLVLYFATNFAMLMAARTLAGFASGLSAPTCYVYLCEISTIRIRGVLPVIHTLMINLACLVSIICASLLPLHSAVLISWSIPILVFLPLSFWLPESPTWLLKQQKNKEAIQSLLILRGKNYEYEPELNDLAASVDNTALGLLDFFKYLSRRECYLPLLIIILAFQFQIFCGIDTTFYYSVQIFKAAGIPINPYLTSIIFQIGFVSGYVLGAVLLYTLRRRTQFILSALIMGTSFILLSLIMSRESSEDSACDFVIGTVVAGITTVTCAFGYSLGYGSVLFSLVAEIFPPKVNGLFCSVAITSRSLASFSLNKTFPELDRVFGLPNLFLAGGLITYISIIFAYFCLPETQGKSLHELVNLYKKKKDMKTEEETVERTDPLEWLQSRELGFRSLNIL